MEYQAEAFSKFDLDKKGHLQLLLLEALGLA